MRIPMFLIAAVASLAAAATTTLPLGYAPYNALPEQTAGQGTGMNNFTEGVILLDPSSPIVAPFKGGKITAIRCYMRQDYKQKTKGYSSVSVRRGDLKAEPERQLVNLVQGWNEVKLDNPVTLDQPVYVGVRVFETKNAAYPLVSFKNSHIPGSCFIESDNMGFADYSDRGALMIQAIVETENPVKPFGIAEISEVPSVLTPEQHFSCSLYVLNISSEPITRAQINVLDPGSMVETPPHYDVAFESPLQIGEGVVMPFRCVAPTQGGLNQPLNVNMTGINGANDLWNSNPWTRTEMYVDADAFVRIPVVEEFTSLPCVNCPMMFYYLDQAIEESEEPVVYLSRHAGFVEDDFTTQADGELLYLFGKDGGTYNPAVMFDRRIMDNSGLPVVGAKVAEVEPYATGIQYARSYPGLARIIVDCDRSNGATTATVSGKLSKLVLENLSKIRLSTYLVEDGIPESEYPQTGVSIKPIDGAPADLAEKYRHNGVVRQILNSNPAGDPIEVDAEGNFSISYPSFTYESDWKAENCQIVAIAYFYDTDNLANNYMLNAGTEKLNDYARGVGINDVLEQNPTIPVYYNLQGHRVTTPQNGIFIKRIGCRAEKVKL